MRFTRRTLRVAGALCLAVLIAPAPVAAPGGRWR